MSALFAIALSYPCLVRKYCRRRRFDTTITTTKQHRNKHVSLFTFCCVGKSSSTSSLSLISSSFCLLIFYSAWLFCRYSLFLFVVPSSPSLYKTFQLTTRTSTGTQHRIWKSKRRQHIQWYAPIKIIGIKIIVPIKSEKSLRLMVHISKTLTKSSR